MSNLKAIVLPSKEIISESIVASLDTHGIREYADLVGNMLGGTKRNGVGVVMALGLQARTWVEMNQYPPMMESVIWQTFYIFIKSFIDDHEVRHDALTHYNKVMNKEDES